MKTLLFSTTIILCLMVGSILCQEEEDSGSSLIKKFQEAIKNVWNSLKDIWSEFKQEMKARTTDMRDWTQEMFESFKQKMKEWIDNSPSASDSEREEMRNYLERMQMENQ